LSYDTWRKALAQENLGRYVTGFFDLVERVLRRTLDPDDAFSDNVSLAETISPILGPEGFKQACFFL
jgi:hypothetical protein